MTAHGFHTIDGRWIPLSICTRDCELHSFRELHSFSTVASRMDHFRDQLAAGDLDGTGMWDLAYDWPAGDRRWTGPVGWAHPGAHPGWQSYLNAAAIRGLTAREGGPELADEFSQDREDLIYGPQDADLGSQLCVSCSHPSSSHGWTSNAAGDEPCKDCPDGVCRTGTPEPRPFSPEFEQLYDEYMRSGSGSWQNWLRTRRIVPVPPEGYASWQSWLDDRRTAPARRPARSRPYGHQFAGQVRGAVALAAEIAGRFGYSLDQIERAGELLADGGVIPTPHHQVFRVVSSDGEHIYYTSAKACSCPRGYRGGLPCYHRAAVEILTAVTR